MTSVFLIPITEMVERTYPAPILTAEERLIMAEEYYEFYVERNGSCDWNRDIAPLLESLHTPRVAFDTTLLVSTPLEPTPPIEVSQKPAWHRFRPEPRRVGLGQPRVHDGVGGAPPSDDWDNFIKEHPWKSFEPLLSQLPPLEAQVLRLTKEGRLRQQDIADRVGVARTYLSRFILQALKRVLFLIDKPVFTDEELEALLSPHLHDTEVAKYIELYKFNTAGSTTHPGSTWLCVRRTLPRLKQVDDPRMQSFVKFAEMANSSNWSTPRPYQTRAWVKPPILEVSSYKPPRARDYFCKATPPPSPHHRGTPPIEETGNTYGDVTVIGRAAQSGLDGSIHWKIRCPFGHESVRAGVVLRYKGGTNRCPQCPKTHSLEYRRMRESLTKSQPPL